ncbi:MAG: cytochrome c oxidase subunit 3 [Myxococcota bacterium]
MPEPTHTEAPLHAEHFESLERQAEAVRLGMWVFLASEALLFAALFALYAGYRAHWPLAFEEGVHHNDIYIGSINTIILIVSSFFAALAVQSLEAEGRRVAVWSLAATVLLGLTFLGLKLWEWTMHVQEGFVPGGASAFFQQHDTPGLPTFATLYYIFTGLHALHVIVGCAILAVFLWLVGSRRLGPLHGYRLEAGVLYWHLVDAIWIFLWPMFYLMGKAS